MLWLSKSLIFFIVGNVFSESMHEASLIEEMDQFIKETRTNKDILNFENYESVLKDFETYPIVSSSEKNSSWCEGIQLINQIRDVNGKLYSKVSLSHPEDTLIVRDTGTQIVHHHPRMRLWNCLDWDNERLVQDVRHVLITDPDTSAEYNTSVPVEELLREKEENPRLTEDLSFEMEEVFRKRKNGFFVEAGASNGETDSHTILFEARHGWTGLLVEPYVNELTSKKRKSFVARTCLGIQERPHFAHFNMAGAVEGSMGGMVSEETESTLMFQCIPLYTLLLSIGNPTVNWFILDIEGAEYQVLKTIPWDKVDIEVLSVETHLAGQVTEGTREEIISFMETRGYHHRRHLTGLGYRNIGVKDDLFIRQDILPTLNMMKHDEL